MHRPTLLSRAASVFTTPRSPQDFLRLVDPLASSRQLRGAVTAVVPEGPDAATIRFRPGRGWQAHQPGQCVLHPVLPLCRTDRGRERVAAIRVPGELVE